MFDHLALADLSSMLLSLLCEVSGSSFCHMSNEDLESSLWSNFMRRSVFLPTSRSDALRSALTQVDELKQLINHFKERYVSHHVLLYYIPLFLTKQGHNYNVISKNKCISFLILERPPT